MDIASLDMDAGGCGVEVLELKLSHFASVHGVGVGRIELLHIELGHSATYLLVRGEADSVRAVLEFRMLDKVLHCVHNLGNTGLVVCAQQGGAVRGDDGLSPMVQKLREIRRVEEKSRYALQGNGTAVVVFDNLRLDISSGGVRSRVHVRNKADCRHILVQVGRDAGHYIAVLVEFGFNTHRCQLIAKQFQQIELFACARLTL